MPLSTTLRPSSIEEGFAAPTVSVGDRNYIRNTGGFFPEQQTFLGATIKSFNISTGKGTSPTSLTVELIEDPSGTNPTIDDPNKANGVYDMYHHNKTGDEFSPPGVGMPVFFVYSNPRVTIQQAYDPNYVVPSYESVLKFGGLLQSFHQTHSIGGRSFSVTVVDPREILSNIYLILNHSDDKVGLEENNIFNVFGFLEYNPTYALRNSFRSYSKNLLRRNATNDQFGGDDMYYLTWPTPAKPGENFTGYFTNTGHTNQFPITGTGMSRRSSSGIPYYRIMQALAAMTSPLPSVEQYGGFSGEITYRGLKYNVRMNSLPPVNPMVFFDHDNIDLLAFLIEAAEYVGYEIVVTLEPAFSDDTGGTIVIDFLDRSNETAVGAIRNFINNPNNFPNEKYTANDGSVITQKTVEKEDIGYELTNPSTSRIIFGSNRVDMYAFTSNHDDGRWASLSQGFGGSNEADNQILPFYGLIGENTFVPTRGDGEWRQMLLDSSGLGAYGVGNYYVATEVELRYALKGFAAWKNFLEFFSGKYLSEINIKNNQAQSKYFHHFVGRNAGLDKFKTHLNNAGVFQRLNHTTFCLKAPRCLFTNDAGWEFIGGEAYPRNPCCPAYGYPLYYGRAVALGLTVKDFINETNSVVADLNALKVYGDDPVVLQKIINRLLEKYKTISRTRRLTATEHAAVVVLRNSTAGLDAEYVDAIINSMSGQTVVLHDNKTTRIENGQKVFNFVKDVAEECYGKKWLVRIPRKPNFRFEATNTTRGIDLDNNKRLYTNGYFGFFPDKSVSSATKDAACPPEASFVLKSNEKQITTPQSLFKPALVTNYNPIDDTLVNNYLPDTTGGFVTTEMYNQGIKTALLPKDLTSFGSDYRIKAYVRYDHAEKLNISAGGKCYTEYVGTDIDRLNSIPRKTDSFDAFDAITNSGTMLAFIPVSLDEKYYYPLTTLSRQVGEFGNHYFKGHPKPIPITLDASGNLPANAGSFETVWQSKPSKFAYSQRVILDFPRDKDGKIQSYPDTDYAFALITMPSMVNIKIDKLSDVPNRDSYQPATYPGQFSNEASIQTVKRIDIKKKIGLADGAVGITFYNPAKLFSVPPAIKPDIVVLPLENQQKCYGPWYNGPLRFKDPDTDTYRYKKLKNLGGKVEIETDAGLAPWNFGSYDLMNLAGQCKVQLASTLYLASEKGSVTYPGLPMGKQEIGHFIAQGGPILDSLSLDVSVDGVHTSYRFQTYSRSFGKIQEQQQKSMDRLKRDALKAGQLNFELLSKGITKNKFKGKVPPATKTKPYSPPLSLYTGYSRPNNKKLSSMYSDGSDTYQQGGVGSSDDIETSNNNESDTFAQAENHYNSAYDNATDGEIAVSKQYHHLLPYVDTLDQESLKSLYDSPLDNYNLNDHEITYWS